MDGVLYALAAVAAGVAVAQFDGFMNAGRRARRYHRFFDRTVAGRDGDRNRRISARIQNFARMNALDEGASPAT